MSSLYLIRHGACDCIGRFIAGRMAGIHLNAEGRRQAEALTVRLADVPFDAIYVSPLERARETAEPVARRAGVTVEVRDELLELDFGDWTGMAFDELARDERWRLFNSMRATTRIPGGELMLEVQARAVSMAELAKARYPNGCVGFVTHGDVLRGLVAHYLGVPLDLFQRLEISPGSVSVLELWPDQVVLKSLNVGPDPTG